METLSELDQLSLVNAICTQLNNFLGMSDTTLAEFIMSLYQDGDIGGFTRRIKEAGVEEPALVESLHRLMKGAIAAAADDDDDDSDLDGQGGERVFSSLALPDTDPVPCVFKAFLKGSY
jgi:ATP-dependent RNA helicase DHX8/PRP22